MLPLLYVKTIITGCYFQMARQKADIAGRLFSFVAVGVLQRIGPAISKESLSLFLR